MRDKFFIIVMLGYLILDLLSIRLPAFDKYHINIIYIWMLSSIVGAALFGRLSFVEAIKVNYNSFVIIFWLFAFYFAFNSLLISGKPLVSASYTLLIFANLIFLLLFLSCLNQFNLNKILLIYLYIVICYLLCCYIYSLLNGFHRMKPIIGGNSNYLSFTILHSCLYVVWLNRKTLISDVNSFLFLVIMSASFFYCGSRTSTLAAITITGIFIIDRHIKIKDILAVAIGLLIAISLIFSLQAFYKKNNLVKLHFNKYTNTLDNVEDLFIPSNEIEDSINTKRREVSSRIDHYKYAFSILMSSTKDALVGVGIESYWNDKETMKLYLNKTVTLHSAFLQYLVGGGIIGFILYLLLFLHLIYSLRYIRHSFDRVFILSIIIASIINALFQPAILSKYVFVIAPFFLTYLSSIPKNVETV